MTDADAPKQPPVRHVRLTAETYRLLNRLRDCLREERGENVSHNESVAYAVRYALAERDDPILRTGMEMLRGDEDG